MSLNRFSKLFLINSMEKILDKQQTCTVTRAGFHLSLSERKKIIEHKFL